MSRVVVDNRVRVPLAGLRPEQAEEIRLAFVHSNPNHGKPRHEGEPPTYRTWEHVDGDLTVPRGGFGRVRAILEPGFRVEDRRTWRHPEPNFPDHRKTLWAHQEELVTSGMEHDSGLWKANTGSGKTSAGYGLLARLKRRSLVVVWSSALLKQWRERAVEELGMAPEDVGHVQGDREIIRPLTLAMQQTLAARFAAGDTALADAFDVLFFDEVQRAPADTAYAAIDPMRARKRIGASADHSRHDELEFFTTDLFGPVIATVDEARTIASGAVVEVEVAVVPTKFTAPWYRYDQDFNRLLAQMVVDPERNALILSLVKSAVDSGEQVIVFTHRVEHARWLDAQIAQMGIPGGLMLGGAPEAQEFDRTRLRLKAGQLRAAVGTYQAIGEGIDVPSVARGIAATPQHNNRQKMGQVKGRICRASKGKTFGRLAVLADVAVYGRRPVENFVGWFKRVVVWNGREWVEGRDYLASLRRRASAA